MLAQTNVIYFINTVFISEVNVGMYVYVMGVLLKDCMPIFLLSLYIHNFKISLRSYLYLSSRMFN